MTLLRTTKMLTESGEQLQSDLNNKADTDLANVPDNTFRDKVWEAGSSSSVIQESDDVVATLPNEVFHLITADTAVRNFSVDGAFPNGGEITIVNSTTKEASFEWTNGTSTFLTLDKQTLTTYTMPAGTSVTFVIADGVANVQDVSSDTALTFNTIDVDAISSVTVNTSFTTVAVSSAVNDELILDLGNVPPGGWFMVTSTSAAEITLSLADGGQFIGEDGTLTNTYGLAPENVLLMVRGGQGASTGTDVFVTLDRQGIDGTTNLSTTLDTDSVTVNSSTGAGATIPAADGTNAGVVSNDLYKHIPSGGITTNTVISGYTLEVVDTFSNIYIEEITGSPKQLFIDATGSTVGLWSVLTNITNDQITLTAAGGYNWVFPDTTTNTDLLLDPKEQVIFFSIGDNIGIMTILHTQQESETAKTLIPLDLNKDDAANFPIGISVIDTGSTWIYQSITNINATFGRFVAQYAWRADSSGEGEFRKFVDGGWEAWEKLALFTDTDKSLLNSVQEGATETNIVDENGDPVASSTNVYSTAGVDALITVASNSVVPVDKDHNLAAPESEVFTRIAIENMLSFPRRSGSPQTLYPGLGLGMVTDTQLLYDPDVFGFNAYCWVGNYHSSEITITASDGTVGVDFVDLANNITGSSIVLTPGSIYIFSRTSNNSQLRVTPIHIPIVPTTSVQLVVNSDMVSNIDAQNEYPVGFTILTNDLLVGDNVFLVNYTNNYLGDRYIKQFKYEGADQIDKLSGRRRNDVTWSAFENLYYLTQARYDKLNDLPTAAQIDTEFEKYGRFAKYTEAETITVTTAGDIYFYNASPSGTVGLDIDSSLTTLAPSAVIGFKNGSTAPISLSGSVGIDPVVWFNNPGDTGNSMSVPAGAYVTFYMDENIGVIISYTADQPVL